MVHTTGSLFARMSRVMVRYKVFHACMESTLYRTMTSNATEGSEAFRGCSFGGRRRSRNATEGSEAFRGCSFGGRRRKIAEKIVERGMDMEVSKNDFCVIDNCLMVRMPEEVDHHGAGIICENADRYLLQENVENVVFDFEKTKFMDSSGIGIIMGRHRKISCFGGRVYAIHADKQIQRIFQLSGLNKIVEVLQA